MSYLRRCVEKTVEQKSMELRREVEIRDINVGVVGIVWYLSHGGR